MSFYNEYSKIKDFSFDNFFQKIQGNDIRRILDKDKLEPWDFLALLSPKAQVYLEQMAQRAHMLSLQNFGKTILLYTPIYISNHCVNKCVYCSFNAANNIARKKLTMQEIEAEAREISKTGLKHVLVLTGESRTQTPVSYIKDAVKVLKEYFEAVSIEIYPLTEEEYKEVINAGVHGLVVYQEVYDEAIYDKLHPGGPKRDYHFRLDAPERACRAKMRSVNIGALLGLNHWRREAFYTGLHADYLQNKYLDVEISISLPRIRPYIGGYTDLYPVGDREFVQIMLGLKIFLPHVGISISTRERQGFRDQLIPLGVTKMSAGVSTEVGGHKGETTGEGQFEISDVRSVAEIRQAIQAKGFQPIFKDWMDI